jgi:type IV fimbrial biogenesis protein FimT
MSVPQAQSQGKCFVFKAHRGFTLIELLVTLTLVGIIMGLGIPSFNEAIKNNRLTSYANELISALNLARSEAVKRGRTVTVRRVDNNSFTRLSAAANWEDGWDVFVDANGNGTFNPANDVQIRTFSGLKENYTLRSNTFSSRIIFGATGTSASGRFVVCDDSDGNGIVTANTSRLIMLITTGRARNMPDTDAPPNGIPDETNGTDNILCDP